MHGGCNHVAADGAKVREKQYMCSWCKKNNAEMPASGSNLKRAIQLYMQVKMASGNLTFLRTVPLRIIVRPPISEWGLRQSLPAMAPLEDANPMKMRCRERLVFEFNATESERLWLHATHLEDVER